MLGSMLGIVTRRSKTPIKKPWTIATNYPEIIEEFSKYKCNGLHEHAPCAGEDTKLTENYSIAFAQAFHTAFARACFRQAGGGESPDIKQQTKPNKAPLCCLVARPFDQGGGGRLQSQPPCLAMASSSSNPQLYAEVPERLRVWGPQEDVEITDVPRSWKAGPNGPHDIEVM